MATSSTAANRTYRKQATLGAPVESDDLAKQEQIQQQFNQLVAEVRLLESYYQEVLGRQQSVSAALIDTRAALEALDSLSLSENSSLLVPIGGGTLIPVEAPPIKNLVVSVGAGVAIEKDRDSAKSFLSARKSELEKAVSSLEQQRKEIGSRLEVGRATIQRIADASAQ
jgi:prefoldin alpha subunit